MISEMSLKKMDPSKMRLVGRKLSMVLQRILALIVVMKYRKTRKLWEQHYYQRILKFQKPILM